MIYLVVCELSKGDATKYEEVAKAIHGKFDNVVQAMNHVWFVDAAGGERSVADRVAPLLTPEDQLFICEITSEHYGFVRQEASKWLLDHSIYMQKHKE